MKELVEVDINLIGRLRREGNYLEADKLISAHQGTLKKNYSNGKRLNNNIYALCWKVRCRRNGLCISCGKRARKGSSRCEECLEKRRVRYRKLRKQGFCVDCSKKKVKDKVICKQCLKNIKEKKNDT